MKKNKKAEKNSPKSIENITVKKYALMPCIVIVLAGLLCYFNTFDSPFHFDDLYTIVENSAIKDIGNADLVSNFPVRRFTTFLSLALNYYFCGLDIFGYHMVNVAIHILNAILVFWFMRLALSAPEISGNVEIFSDGAYRLLIPLFAALLFVSHPVQTQAVTYIIQRSASMATLFYLLSMTLYLKAAVLRHEYGEIRTFSSTVYLLLSILSAALAMVSKEIAFTLPIAVVLVEIFFISASWEKIKKRIFILSPLLLTVLAVPVVMRMNFSMDIEEIGRLASETGAVSRKDYFLTQLNVLGTYIRLMFFPFNQNIDYDYPVSKTFFEWKTIFSFILLVFTAFLAAGLFKKQRIISFGIIFFFLALSVESSIIPISDVIFEHRLYLPSIGFVIVVSVGLFSFFGVCRKTFFSKEPSTQNRRHAIYILVLFSSLFLSMAGINTHKRNIVWKTDISLWKDAVDKSPNKARAYGNLGMAYADQGRWKEAARKYRESLRIEPDYFKSRNNLGSAYLNLTRYQEALQEYQTALRLNPDHPHVTFNIGITLANLGRWQESVRAYQKVLLLKPDYAKARNQLGIAYAALGRWEESILEYQKYLRTIRKNSDVSFHVFLNMAKGYARLTRWQEASESLKQALRIKPDDVNSRNNLGIVYDALGLHDEAVTEYQKVVLLKPGIPEPHNNLGLTYMKTGRYRKAEKSYHIALRLKPDYPEARYNLGNIYFLQNQWKDAMREWNTVLSVDPNHKAAQRGLKAVREKTGSTR